ncbi:MAG: tRNA (adenosine(37)-N6)-dimethylallyltransferase MiaA [Bacteriovoracaceae bacterium]|nr:tRNA (adenosine(37)-N6)-dimethylallyltransferase MiaA [Bacteriovoracaceae bacterium]
MKVIVISGPTASGKTDLAVELASTFGGEVVNFDSLLLYKEINIGTAKPTAEEQKSIPHHMIDVRSISEPMNAADYAREALPIIEKLLSENKLVYLVGGSGFYLQALLKGMYDSPTTPDEITKKSNELYEKEGIAPFLEFLKTHDLKSFERYHANDHYRVRRAVEHFWTTGSPLSEARAQKDESNQKLEEVSIHGWDILHLYLDLPKDEHLKIIERRTERMLSEGLLAEVQGLLDQGFSGEEKPLQSIGYKESLAYLMGVFSSLEECRERIIISTRQLAKSQRTWFKRDTTRETFHPLNEKKQIIEVVRAFLQS